MRIQQIKHCDAADSLIRSHTTADPLFRAKLDDDSSIKQINKSSLVNFYAEADSALGNPFNGRPSRREEPPVTMQLPWNRSRRGFPWMGQDEDGTLFYAVHPDPAGTLVWTPLPWWRRTLRKRVLQDIRNGQDWYLYRLGSSSGAVAVQSHTPVLTGSR